MHPDARKLSLESFLAQDEPKEVQELIGTFNGGAFMCCHTQIFAQTGIWIEDLVPVFQKLDAKLAVNNDRMVAQLGG